MIASIKHKGLKNYWEKNNAKGLNPDWLIRITQLLSLLDKAKSLDAVNFIGSSFHPLTGHRAGQYALKVHKNWRIVFEWKDQNVINLGLEDYH